MIQSPEKHAQDSASDEAEAEFRLDNFLPFHLAVVANRVSQEIARLIETEFNLHIPEWRILATLVYQSPCSSLELVRHTAMDPARVSRAQSRLADLGLISVEQDPADKRRVIVNITDQGRTITSAIAPQALKVETKLLQGLSSAEYKVFRRVLAQLFEATIPGGE